MPPSSICGGDGQRIGIVLAPHKVPLFACTPTAKAPTQQNALAPAACTIVALPGDCLELLGRVFGLLYPAYSYKYFAIFSHLLCGVANKTYSTLALLDVLLLACTFRLRWRAETSLLRLSNASKPPIVSPCSMCSCSLPVSKTCLPSLMRCSTFSEACSPCSMVNTSPIHSGRGCGLSNSSLVLGSYTHLLAHGSLEHLI